jgi:hypothetical protein
MNARSPLTTSQLEQLKTLWKMGAVTEATAVDRRTTDLANRSQSLNMVMIGTALFPRGLVARVERRAKYGEPKRRLYYLTREGAQAAGLSS